MEEDIESLEQVYDCFTNGFGLGDGSSATGSEHSSAAFGDGADSGVVLSSIGFVLSSVILFFSGSVSTITSFDGFDCS